LIYFKCNIELKYILLNQIMEENEERNKIVHKYKRGRNELLKKEIDEWEDPQFEIYHVTDRYGFIQ
jgi:hypothetical protein